MIYDCFIFFNELDLLELRLNVLNSVVDKFVIVEATKTFQFKDKPLYYQENKERFKEFESKIIHVVVDKYPDFWTNFRKPITWDYENYQRNQIKKGLKACKRKDVVIVSDLDEIPKPEKIIEYKDFKGVKNFEQYFCQFYFNYRLNKSNQKYPIVNREGVFYWCGSVMMHYKDFVSAQDARSYIIDPVKGRSSISISKGGWHFTYLGNIEHVITKLKSFSHSEFNNDYHADKQRIINSVKNKTDIFDRGEVYEIVDIDTNDFPEFLKQNKNKYKDFIL